MRPRIEKGDASQISTTSLHYSRNGALGQVVRRLREQAGLTRYELARDTAISHSQLTNIETKDAEPLLNTAVSLARVLGAKLERQPISVLAEISGLATPEEVDEPQEVSA